MGYTLNIWTYWELKFVSLKSWNIWDIAILKTWKKTTKNNEQTRNTNEEINFCKVFCSMSLVKHPAIKKENGMNGTYYCK